MIYRMFETAMNRGIVTACMSMPRNLRQWYADQLMLMRVEVEFGI